MERAKVGTTENGAPEKYKCKVKADLVKQEALIFVHFIRRQSPSQFQTTSIGVWIMVIGKT